MSICLMDVVNALMWYPWCLMLGFKCFILFSVDYLYYTRYTRAHTCASCISWGTINNRVMRKTNQVDPKRGLIRRMMLMNRTEDGQTKQVSEQKMVTKWSPPNNTNLVLLRQAPVHSPPPWCFKIFITLFDALGDRSCVLNRWCISLLEIDYPSLIPVLKRILWCLALL